MTTSADLLAQRLAKAGRGAGPNLVSAQVVDVTEDGKVNLNLQGTLVTDVPCTDAYRGRRAGDWVKVRLGAHPLVEYRVGADPGQTDEESVRSVAEAAQVVRSVTWGTTAPSGTGWQQASALPYLRKSAAGQVELYFPVSTVLEPSPDAPPAQAPKAVTISPTDAGTWRNGRPDDYASHPMQGDWTGGGARRGAWFYGTQIQDACTGKTVADMRVTFTRRRGSGYNGSRALHVYLHGYTSAPSGQLVLGDGPEDVMALSVGATRTASLPASWAVQLAAGTARGLAIYSTGPRDYMAVSGGRLAISFSA
ncbi:hypothetical protein [Streptomyces sp. DH37]|uniref:hypothetical protein n=1 Tax=Streptomyces sp. DH37 TaxID=3040122 RepID=UPI00244178C0|nr:hypothetical protein [Streptomyces sp. DH37]MDG9706261.1 hypothetical protein [Streptomyces sp. DH37]